MKTSTIIMIVLGIAGVGLVIFLVLRMLKSSQATQSTITPTGGGGLGLDISKLFNQLLNQQNTSIYHDVTGYTTPIGAEKGYHGYGYIPVGSIGYSYPSKTGDYVSPHGF